MQTKALALFALSATAAFASPLHKRQQHGRHHHSHHGTGAGSAAPTDGVNAPFPAGNGTFGQVGTGTGLPVLTETVRPVPATETEVATAFETQTVTSFNKVASSVVAPEAAEETECVSTSTATAYSTKMVTVTAREAQAGAFYGSQQWGGGRPSWGSNTWGNGASTMQTVTTPAAAPSFAPSAVGSAVNSFVSGASSAASSVASSLPTNAPSTGGSSSGGKKGISYNSASLVKAFGNSVSWAYNWAATADGSPGVEFVPMMWGLDSVSSFAGNVGSSASHVLSFNEPDLAAQSNIDPATAAKQHIAGMSALKGKVQISSPAITNGQGTSPLMGIDWLNQWFTDCAGQCPVDFVAYHWYGTDIEDFKQHTNNVITAAKNNGVSKVWLTEFAPTGSADSQATFMQAAVSFLDSTPEVERYAPFMASDGTLLSGSSLNSVGSAFVSTS